jgi:phosphoribosyl 1,2-cyclic phosphodiesterase
MNIVSIASGSKGNVTLVKTDRGNILIDVGLSMKKINEKLLMAEGIDLNDINYIFISHSHLDHIGSLHTIYNKYEDIEFIVNQDVFDTVKDKLRVIDFDRMEVYDVGTYFLKGITVTPFELTHDKPTIGFKIEETSTGESLVFIADNGMLHYKFKEMNYLFNATYYMIESNYDARLTYLDEKRDIQLKKRCLGMWGHSENIEAIEKLVILKGDNTKGVMFHHLSEETNSEELSMSMHLAYLNVWSKLSETKNIKISYARQNESVSINDGLTHKQIRGVR